MRVPVLLGASLSLLLGGGVATSCSEGCDSAPNCFSTGVAVGLPAQRSIAAVKICVDGDCETDDVTSDDSESIFTFADHGLGWKEGTSVVISLTIIDSAGDVVTTLEERRKMFDTECTCATFLYRFDGSALVRAD